MYEYFFENFKLFFLNFNFFSFFENFFLQTVYLIVLFNFFKNNNIYYNTFSIFILFFLMGLFLLFFQLDLFTGFLWLIELTVIFIFLLMLFYLNFKGNTNKEYKNINFIFLSSLLIIIFFIKYTKFNINSDNPFITLNCYLFWEDYYESFNNNCLNDFYVLLLSYYFFNSFGFFLIGFLLFIGSILCINLFVNIKINNSKNLSNFLKSFDFFKNSMSFSFLRKQNMYFQNLTIPSLRILKKK